MAVSGVGSSSTAELAQLQRQLRDDQLTLQKALLSGADQTAITADQLAVQTDQLAIAAAQTAAATATADSSASSASTTSTATEAADDSPGDTLDLEASSSSTFQIDA